MRIEDRILIERIQVGKISSSYLCQLNYCYIISIHSLSLSFYPKKSTTLILPPPAAAAGQSPSNKADLYSPIRNNSHKILLIVPQKYFQKCEKQFQRRGAVWPAACCCWWRKPSVIFQGNVHQLYSACLRQKSFNCSQKFTIDLSKISKSYY